MKLADVMMMDKRIINEVNEKLKDLSEDEMERLKLLTLGSSLIAECICEIMDCDSIANANLSMNDRALLMLQIIASGTVTALLKLAFKTNNLEMTINGFKHYFEGTIQKLGQLK